MGEMGNAHKIVVGKRRDKTSCETTLALQVVQWLDLVKITINLWFLEELGSA
jgi:hypothetical protein